MALTPEEKSRQVAAKIKNRQQEQKIADRKATQERSINLAQSAKPEQSQVAIKKASQAGAFDISKATTNTEQPPATATQVPTTEVPEVEPAPIAENILESESFSLATGQLEQESLESQQIAEKFGLETSTPSNFQEFVDDINTQQEEETELLNTIQALDVENEQLAFQQAKNQSRSATAATTMSLAQSREAPIGSGKPQAMANFKATVDTQIQIQRNTIARNTALREKAKADLARAQESEDQSAIDTIKGRIALADQRIRDAEVAAQEAANKSVELAMDIRSQAFDFMEVAPAGSLGNLGIEQVMASFGVDGVTANVMIQMDQKKLALESRQFEMDQLEYAERTLALEIDIQNARFAGMTNDQKNFEYYKQLAWTDPASAEEFAQATGIKEKSFFSNYQTQWSNTQQSIENTWNNSGAIAPPKSKYKFDIVDGGISFRNSAPEGQPLSSARRQCGMFVNDCLNGGPGLFGDSFSNKMGKVNSQFPVAGGAFVEKTDPTIGHVGMVEKVYPDGSFDIRESNYKKNAQGVPIVTTAHISPGSPRWNTIVQQGGFYVPEGAPQTARQTPSQLGADNLERNPVFMNFAKGLADNKINTSDLKSMGMTGSDIAALQNAALKITPTKVDGILNKDQSSTFITLKNQYRNRPEVQEFKAVQASYSKILSAQETAAGDLSLIFNYMKMLDPGSVVREGEFANAQNAAGVPTKIMNVYNRAITGERLAPEQKQDFKNQAKFIFDSSKQIFDQTEGEFRNDALLVGLPEEIEYDLGGFDFEGQRELQEIKDALDTFNFTQDFATDQAQSLLDSIILP